MSSCGNNHNCKMVILFAVFFLSEIRKGNTVTLHTLDRPDQIRSDQIRSDGDFIDHRLDLSGKRKSLIILLARSTSTLWTIIIVLVIRQCAA